MEAEKHTPASFARAIQINPSALSHILNGRNQPSMDVVKKILLVYSAINPDWILFGKGNMYRHGSSGVQMPSLFDATPQTPTQPETTATTAASESQAIAPVAAEMRSNNADSDLSLSIDCPREAIKAVKKIIVYYSDNTFEEFLSH